VGRIQKVRPKKGVDPARLVGRQSVTGAVASTR
jgi:hypothetical protein